MPDNTMQAGSPANSDRFSRYFFMLRSIPREPRRIGAPELLTRLQHEGFDVTLRTVQRDLEQLSALFGLQCDTRDKPHGWYWLKTAPVLDIPGLSLHAALTFKLAETYLRDTLPASTLAFLTPYFSAADTLLSGNADKPLARWNERVRIISPGPGLIPPPVDPVVHEAVYASVFDNRKLKVSYQSLGASLPAEYVVNPLALVVRDGVIYLVCIFDGYQDTRQLALHRMKHAEALASESAGLPGFDLEAYIGAGEFNTARGSMIALRCRFRLPHGKYLLETPLCRDQQIHWENEHQFILEASVPWTEALMRWLLGWSHEIEILGPEDFLQVYRNRVRLLAERVLGADQR